MPTNKGTHIDVQTLRRFVAGSLDNEATNRVMAHLAECDACLEMVDQLWTEKPTTTVSKVADLDRRTARSIERRLLKRINRSNLGGTMVNFGIGGFANVLLAIIRPFLAKTQTNSTLGEHDD